MSGSSSDSGSRPDVTGRAAFGSASAAVADALGGPRRTGAVISAGPRAAYADFAGRVVALVGPDAVALPNAVRLVEPDRARLTEVVVGATAVAGAGRLRLGPVVVEVSRWWNPVPALPCPSPAALRAARAVLAAAHDAWPPAGTPAAERLRARTDALAAAVAGADVDAARRHAAGLVGLGGGATPAGDDVLAGLLATAVLLGDVADRPGAVRLAGGIGEVVEGRRGHTTPLSATLLDHARRGEVAEPAGGLLRAVARGAGVATAHERLARLGHTSGADLTVGVAIGLAAVLAAPVRGSVPARRAPAAVSEEAAR